MLSKPMLTLYSIIFDGDGLGGGGGGGEGGVGSLLKLHSLIWLK